MDRDLSGGRCREGRNWGSSDTLIWAGAGCRAIFEVSYRSAGPASATRRISCGAADELETACKVGGSVTAVRLLRDLSGGRCGDGRNWGRNADFVWTTRGCRGEFEVTYRELAKVAQKAPSACPIEKSGCSDDWTRYLSELAAVKQRIDRPNTSCEGADASPERAHVLEHQAYQSRAYQSHVEKLAGEMQSADAKATFARMLQAAEKAHSTPPCVEPGQ